MKMYWGAGITHAFLILTGDSHSDLSFMEKGKI
jgi:hypothetical protein